MKTIIELNNEFESSPFNDDDNLDLQNNIFENDSISDFKLIYNDFIIFILSSCFSVK